jgi:hypothetical protein
VQVMDNTIDDSIPLGEVRVRYSGGKRAEILRVIDATRAAGVLVQLQEIRTVRVFGTVYVIPHRGIAQDVLGGAVERFRTIIIGIINDLSVGDPLPLRRVASRMYQIDVFADIAEVQLRKEGDDPTAPYQETLLVENTEVMRPKEQAVRVIPLTSLKIAGEPTTDENGNTVLDLQLRTADGVAAKFGLLNLDVTVVLKGTTLRDDMPVRFNSYTRRVTFENSSTAPLLIRTSDADGEPSDLLTYRPEDHKNEISVTVTAAAFGVFEGDSMMITIGA